MNTTITVNGKKLHLILGKTKKEILKETGHDDSLWDFPLEELLDGTVEIDEDNRYFYCEGRCYETDIKANNQP